MNGIEQSLTPRPSPLGSSLPPPARALGIAAAIVVSGLSIWAASRFTREPPPEAAAPPGMHVGKDDVTIAPDAPQWKAVKLATAKAAAPGLSDPVPARVKIDEARASRVGTPLAGRVTTVFVELGQPVKVGDPLFAVTSPDIAGLRNEREKAAVDLEVAKAALERVKAMVALSAVPAKDELEANQQYLQAKLALRFSQSKLASLKVSAKADNEFIVVSPRDGVVVEKDVLPAQEVSSEATLVSVADLSAVWVVADLFESDAVGIHEGGAAQVTSPSLPGFAANTTVARVSAVVDPVRHTVPVRVMLPNAAGELKPNIYAQMRFEVAPPPGAVEIPASALVSDGEHQYVYVEEQAGRLVRRPAVAGSAHDGVLPVMQGLAPGDVVVEEGALLLDNQIDLSQ